MRPFIRPFVPGALALLLAAAPPTSAVTLSNARIGVLGGASFAKLAGVHSPVLDFQQVKSAAYGIALRLPLDPTFSVELEVLQVTDGLSLGESERTDESGNALGTFETLHVLDRIQIPVLVQATLPPPGRVKPFVFAGPWVAVTEREYDRDTGDVKNTRTNALLESTDWGLTLGGGALTKLGPGHAEVQARYDAGLTKLGRYLGLGPARTSAFRVMLGYGL